MENIAVQKNIALVNKVDSNVIAFFDLNLISTVIRNLLSNAIKFTPKNGSITISSVQSSQKLIVVVEDTGIGIPEDRIDKVFDKFSYETTFGTNAEKGSGLGLKISIDFVEKHHGKIWAESQVGKGSTFMFSLPLEKFLDL